MLTSDPVVFLIDVDNSLLDNDRFPPIPARVPPDRRTESETPALEQP